MTLAILIIIYLLKVGTSFIPKTPKADTETDKAMRFMMAFLWPLLAFAKVFVWNTWASHWIGWPQITTLEQYLVTMLFL